jgi:hypothetical protein
MRIMFERTGGLMRQKINLSIDLNDLPSDQGESIRKLLVDTNFFTLSDNPPTPNPDEFQYTITVKTELAEHIIHTSDTTASKELQPLLEELSRSARLHRLL